MNEWQEVIKLLFVEAQNDLEPYLFKTGLSLQVFRHYICMWKYKIIRMVQSHTIIGFVDTCLQWVGACKSLRRDEMLHWCKSALHRLEPTSSRWRLWQRLLPKALVQTSPPTAYSTYHIHMNPCRRKSSVYKVHGLGM